MPSRRTYTPNDIARALAMLEVNGGAVRETARAVGVPVMTLVRWRDSTCTVRANQTWSEEIRELWEETLSSGLRAAIAITEQAQDQEWLAAQDAHGLGVMFGIFQDKARLLTEAARRAGMDRPQLTEPADEAEDT